MARWLCALIALSISAAVAKGQAQDFVVEGSEATVDERPTITSVLTQAMDLTEQVGTEAGRISTRFRIASIIRTTGHEVDFGDYVVRATEAFEARIRQQFPPDPQREAQRAAERSRLTDLEAEARRYVSAGDLSRAEQLFLAGEELREDYDRRGILGARFSFLKWALEIGDLAGAQNLLDITDWENPTSRIGAARMVAQAHVAAGHYARGLGVLLEMWPSPGQSDAGETFSRLGEALWNLGAVTQAFGSFREASKASLAAARKSVKLPLWGYSGSEPLSIARLQMAIGDQEGARNTLRSVQEFATDYEWSEARAERAWIFARAGFEAEAFAVLDEPEVDQPNILANIVRGQAERGAFEAAFRSLERIQRDSLAIKAESSWLIMKPDGTVSSVSGARARAAQDSERKEACRQAAVSIAVNAARLGDATAFHQADAIGWQADPNHWNQHLESYLSTSLKRLVRTRGAKPALTFVDTFDDPNRRLQALVSVAEGMAGIVNPRDDLYP